MVDMLTSVYCVWAQAYRIWFLLGKVVEILLFRFWQCTRHVTSSVTHRASFRARGVLLPFSLYAFMSHEKVYLTSTLHRKSTSVYAKLVCLQNVRQWFNTTRSDVIGINVVSLWSISISVNQEHSRRFSEQCSREANVCVTCRSDLEGGGRSCSPEFGLTKE
jgi:hypothetical protein